MQVLQGSLHFYLETGKLEPHLNICFILEPLW
jgi:hypothetical protein